MPHPNDLRKHAQDLRRAADDADRQAAQLERNLIEHDNHIREHLAKINELENRMTQAASEKARLQAQSDASPSQLQDYDRIMGEAEREMRTRHDQIRQHEGEKNRLMGKSLTGPLF